MPPKKRIYKSGASSARKRAEPARGKSPTPVTPTSSLGRTSSKKRARGQGTRGSTESVTQKRKKKKKRGTKVTKEDSKGSSGGGVWLSPPTAGRSASSLRSDSSQGSRGSLECPPSPAPPPPSTSMQKSVSDATPTVDTQVTSDVFVTVKTKTSKSTKKQRKKKRTNHSTTTKTTTTTKETTETSSTITSVSADSLSGLLLSPPKVGHVMEPSDSGILSTASSASLPFGLQREPLTPEIVSRLDDPGVDGSSSTTVTGGRRGSITKFTSGSKSSAIEVEALEPAALLSRKEQRMRDAERSKRRSRRRSLTEESGPERRERERQSVTRLIDIMKNVGNQLSHQQHDHEQQPPSATVTTSMRSMDSSDGGRSVHFRKSSAEDCDDLTSVISGVSSNGSSSDLMLPMTLPQIGDRVLISNRRTGMVKYVGPLHARGVRKGVVFVGLELESPFKGTCSGRIQGVQYFHCSRPGQGLFIMPKKMVQILEGPSILGERHSSESASPLSRAEGEPMAYCPSSMTTDARASVEDSVSVSTDDQIRPSAPAVARLKRKSEIGSSENLIDLISAMQRREKDKQQHSSDMDGDEGDDPDSDDSALSELSTAPPAMLARPAVVLPPTASSIIRDAPMAPPKRRRKSRQEIREGITGSLKAPPPIRIADKKRPSLEEQLDRSKKGRMATTRDGTVIEIPAIKPADAFAAESKERKRRKSQQMRDAWGAMFLAHNQSLGLSSIVTSKPHTSSDTVDGRSEMITATERSSDEMIMIAGDVDNDEYDGKELEEDPYLSAASGSQSRSRSGSSSSSRTSEAEESDGGRRRSSVSDLGKKLKLSIEVPGSGARSSLSSKVTVTETDDDEEEESVSDSLLATKSEAPELPPERPAQVSGLRERRMQQQQREMQAMRPRSLRERRRLNRAKMAGSNPVQTVLAKMSGVGDLSESTQRALARVRQRMADQQALVSRDTSKRTPVAAVHDDDGDDDPIPPTTTRLRVSVTGSGSASSSSLSSDPMSELEQPMTSRKRRKSKGDSRLAPPMMAKSSEDATNESSSSSSATAAASSVSRRRRKSGVADWWKEQREQYQREQQKKVERAKRERTPDLNRELRSQEGSADSGGSSGRRRSSQFAIATMKLRGKGIGVTPYSSATTPRAASSSSSISGTTAGRRKSTNEETSSTSSTTTTTSGGVRKRRRSSIQFAADMDAKIAQLTGKAEAKAAAVTTPATRSRRNSIEALKGRGTASKHITSLRKFEDLQKKALESTTQARSRQPSVVLPAEVDLSKLLDEYQSSIDPRLIQAAAATSFMSPSLAKMRAQSKKKRDSLVKVSEKAHSERVKEWTEEGTIKFQERIKSDSTRLKKKRGYHEIKLDSEQKEAAKQVLSSRVASQKEKMKSGTELYSLLSLVAAKESGLDTDEAGATDATRESVYRGTDPDLKRMAAIKPTAEALMYSGMSRADEGTSDSFDALLKKYSTATEIVKKLGFLVYEPTRKDIRQFHKDLRRERRRLKRMFAAGAAAGMSSSSLDRELTADTSASSSMSDLMSDAESDVSDTESVSRYYDSDCSETSASAAAALTRARSRSMSISTALKSIPVEQMDEFRDYCKQFEPNTLNMNGQEIFVQLPKSKLSLLYEIIARCIVECESLTYVKMCRCLVTDEFLMIILKKLTAAVSQDHCKQLTELWFDSNSISDTGFRRLGQFLRTNNTVKCVKMQHNLRQIATDICEQFLEDLLHNHTLLKFSFHFRHIHHRDSLERVIRRNWEEYRLRRLKEKRMHQARVQAQSAVTRGIGSSSPKTAGLDDGLPPLPPPTGGAGLSTTVRTAARRSSSGLITLGSSGLPRPYIASAPRVTRPRFSSSLISQSAHPSAVIGTASDSERIRKKMSRPMSVG